MFACAPSFVIFFARASLFVLVFRSLRCCNLGCTYQYAFNSTAPTRTAAALAVPVTTYAAAVCTYDLQHSPWLLLLLFIVNRLLIVYHAVLLLCHSYHPAHAFVKSTMYMLEVYQLHLWRPVLKIVTFSFCVSFFFQLRLGSQSTYNYSRNSRFVCTGQRLVRARVVLWSTGNPVLASMKHFASFPSDLVAAYFFIYRVFSFFQVFYSSTRANPGLVWNKQKRQHVWHIRVIRVHIHIYWTHILWYNYNITAVLLHVVGTQI